MGGVDIAAPAALAWFFQHSHRPWVQDVVGLESLHEFLEVQNEKQELVETACDGGNRQGLALVLSHDHMSGAHLQACRYHDPSLSP